MFAICDVNEYRRCAAEFKLPLINQLFDLVWNQEERRKRRGDSKTASHYESRHGLES